MHRRSPVRRLAIGSLTAAGALLALAAAPIGSPARAGSDGAGPGDDTSDTSDTSDASVVAPRRGGPDRVAFERQIDMLLGLVPRDEMEAYNHERNAEYDRRIADCMIDAGFEYSVEPDQGVSVDTTGIEWAQLWGLGIFTSMDPEHNPSMNQEWHDPNQEYRESLSEAEETAFWAQQDRCYEHIDFNDESTALWSNSEFSRVMQDLWADIDNDPKVVAANRTWAGCMEAAGHPYSTLDEANEWWNSSDQNEMRQRFYASEAWLVTSPDHDEWQRMVDLEISLAVALQICNAPIDEVRDEVTRSRRAELLELYQTIDWGAPPVAWLDDRDEWSFDGTIAVADDRTTTRDGGDSSTTTTRPRIDLSGASDDG